jgi:uncharacterized membrane protein YkoI
MSNKDIEDQLKNALAHITPDVRDKMLAQCDAEERKVFILQPEKRKWQWVQTASAFAAVFAFAFVILFAYVRIDANRVETLVMLDINPSIEIKINKADRVIEADAKNDDAVKILDHMDLKNTHINVAVNALVGSMLKYGYIQESANSVLLSVGGANGEKNAALQKTLTLSIGQQLDMVNGAVISQNLSADDAIQQLAAENQVSYGKAALVQKILNENSHLIFADLAKLSVNELNLLVESKGIAASGMEARGTASDTAYIGVEKATNAALDHASINENDAAQLHVELDFDDGIMVYDVEFYYNNTEYEYEVNASDGAVLSFDKEQENDNGKRETKKNAPQTQTSEEFIGEEQAVAIAETHAGIMSHTNLKAELDKDDGIYVYEVEFDADHIEYDYEISATTGEIISWESEEKD